MSFLSTTTLYPSATPAVNTASGLRWYSKLVCLAVIGLIFKGALVTSNNAGLAVPDWPTTFGENMFLYPPSKWHGNIFYEHVHRLIASGVGFLTVILTVWVAFVERRRWVRMLTFFSMAAVIVQGILGGLTVRYLLPLPISVAHGVLAQTFFIATLVIAFSQSREYAQREEATTKMDVPVFRSLLLVIAAIYFQLILGAVMRHSESGIAVTDFPTMAGAWLPSFDATMVATATEMRRAVGFTEPITAPQLLSHFLHRLGAVLVVAVVVWSAVRTFRLPSKDPHSRQLKGTIVALLVVLAMQFFLGIFTVLSARHPLLTSLHVMMGAALLGIAVLAALRASSLGRRRSIPSTLQA